MDEGNIMIFDDLGRIRIPKRIREEMGIEDFEKFEVIPVPKGHFVLIERPSEKGGLAPEMTYGTNDDCLILRRVKEK